MLSKHPKFQINYQDSEGYTALMRAVIFNQVGIVEDLLDFPSVNYNVVNNKKETALILTLRYKLTIIALMLLEKKNLDVTAKDFLGHDAAYYAAQNGMNVVAFAINNRLNNLKRI